MKHAISKKWLANQNQARTTFPHNLWSSYGELIYYLHGDSHAHIGFPNHVDC